jgi:hypothetical protein
MQRGGKRPNAGRPLGSGKYGEPTKTFRLPLSLLAIIYKQFPELKDFAVWLRAQLETNEKNK